MKKTKNINDASLLIYFAICLTYSRWLLVCCICRVRPCVRIAGESLFRFRKNALRELEVQERFHTAPRMGSEGMKSAIHVSERDFEEDVNPLTMLYTVGYSYTR